MKRKTAIFLTLMLFFGLIYPALGEKVLAQADTETTTIDVINSKTVRTINDGVPEAHEPGEWSPSYGAHINYVGYDEDAGDIYEEESILQFDLDKVSDKIIVSAKLKFDVLFGSNADWGIWASDDNVWESGATIPDKTRLINNGTGVEGGVNSIDVTSFFTSEFNGAAEKATFILSHTDPSKKGSQSYFVFYSMGENLPGNRQQPTLEVTYLANQPPIGQIEIVANEDHFVNHRNVFLQITGEDLDGDPMEINISNSSIFVEEEWKPFKSPHRQEWELLEEDGLKTVYMQLRDAHGNRSDVYEASVTLDTTKPTGSVTINNGAEYTTNPHVTLVIEGIDDHGVAQMRFSNQAEDWSSSTWVPYATTHGWTLDASDDGEKMVYMLLQDKAGNPSELITSNIILLDTKAPQGTLEINSGATHTKDTKVQLTLTADDGNGTNFVQMKFSNNNQTWSSWEPFEASKEWYLAADEGQKTVYMKLRDAAGNESEDEISGSIYLDITPPTGSVTMNGGAKYTNSRDVKLSVSADDGGGVGDIQVQFSNDEQTWSDDHWIDNDYSTEEYDWQLTEGDGAKFVYMKLRDGLGNESTSAIKSDSIILDTIPPTVTGVVHDGIYNVDVTIGFNEGTATLNGASFVNGATVSAEGSYTLIVTDVAGNITTVEFVIDKTAPIVTGVEDGEIYNVDVTIGFNEGTATLNGASFVSGATVSAEGSYTLIVTDAAGNITTVEFVIDKTPPTGTVSINNGTDYTNTLEVDLYIGEDSGTPNSIQMRFSNISHTWEDDWEPLKETKSWTLDDNGMSKKTVYMQLRDKAGNVSAPISSAPITYKSIPVPLDLKVKGEKDKALILQKTDFTYTNADGTEIHSIKVVTLPDGELSLGSKKVILDQEILMSEIELGELIFTPNQGWHGTTELTWNAGNGYEFSDTIGKLIIEYIPSIDAPDRLHAIAGDSKVTLNWSEIHDAASYTVFKHEGDSAPDDPSNWIKVESGISGTTYTVISLTNGRSYTFAVTAVNTANVESDYSSTVTARPQIESRPERPELPSTDDPEWQDRGEGSSSLSNNANLQQLEIRVDGMIVPLMPAFSPSITKYTARTQAKRVTIGDLAVHLKAKVMWQGKMLTGDIQVDLQEGENVFELIVQAEDGTRKTYTLTIHRSTSEQEPKEPLITFTDIHGHWAEKQIRQAIADKIVRGYTDGTFKPDNPMTRAEFIVVLMNVLKLEEGATISFIDNDKIGTWAKRAVARATKAGIVGGYSDGSFRPNAPVTRAEMALMIAKSFGLPTYTISATGFADDTDIPIWAKGAVETLREQGVAEGRGNNRFVPNASVTRAEAVALLLGILDTK